MRRPVLFPGLILPHDVLLQRLFDYISGANEDGKKIPMTAPVVTAVLPGEGCEPQLSLRAIVVSCFCRV
jgi:hypothetical protein